MPIPPDFLHESLYTADQWFLHDLEELSQDRVVGITDTTRLGAMVQAQVVRTGHPKHVPAAVMVQLTGTLGNLHAVYVLGCKMSQGWTGFGTNVKNARFPSIGKIGPPMRVICEIRRVRNLKSRFFCEYSFRYEQEDRVVYQSEQAAFWMPGALLEASP